MFQFPSSSIQLPGFSFETDDPDGYVPKYERNAALIDAPLHCNCQVVALRSSAASDRLQLDTEHGMIEVKHVVVATGPFQTPHIPALVPHCPSTYFKFTRATIAIHGNCHRARSWLWGAAHPAARLPKSFIRRDEKFFFRWANFIRHRAAIAAATSTGGSKCSEFGTGRWSSSPKCAISAILCRRSGKPLDPGWSRSIGYLNTSARWTWSRTTTAHGKVSHCRFEHHKFFACWNYRFAGNPRNRSRHRMAFNPRSLFGIDCVQCGNELIAPERTEYLDHQLIRHGWHCPKCHARFESFPRFPPDATRVKDLVSKMDVFPGLRET